MSLQGSGEEEIVGVGIVFREDEEGHVIGQLVPGSGADKCGRIQVGDRLVEVDGRNVSARPVQDLAKLFAGPPDTVVQVKLLRSKDRGGNGGAGEQPLISFDDGADDAKQGEEEDEEGLEVVVDVIRVKFESDKESFVSWIDIDDSDNRPQMQQQQGANRGGGRSAAGSKSLFAEGVRYVSPLHGKILSSVSGLKSSVAPLGDSFKAWGSQQVKGVSDAVQQTSLFENLSNKAVIVKQHTSAATSAAMQGIKALGSGQANSDPAPKKFAMHLYTCPEAYVIMPPTEPKWIGAEAEQAIAIQKVSMEVKNVEVSEAAEITRGRAKMEIFGVLGIANLQCASYLVFITQRLHTATLPQGDVYRAVDIEVREIGKTVKRGPVEESRRAIEERMLSEMLDTSCLLFSYDFDVTHTQQRLSELEKHVSRDPDDRSGLWERWSDRQLQFVWNKTILEPFDGIPPTRITLPVVCGFVQQVSVVVPTGTVMLSLIARRDWRRAGYRYMSRGVDESGAASNFVETEQVVEAGPIVSSFVVVRGSIPLLWQEAESFVSFKPKPQMHTEGDAPLLVHMCQQELAYGKVSVLSLIEQSESSHEHQLSTCFTKAMSELCPHLQYVQFDFHKVCGKLSFKHLPKLAAECDESLSDYGYFVSHQRLQSGVFRVNCIDCLDRTNVAQSVLAFRTLMSQLSSVGCIEADHKDACIDASRKDTKMPLEWAALLHQQFKSLWADHGDTISIQYSGSQALKGDLTRTGKRTVGGLLQDGVSSIRRAVQNNFADYHRQQIMELFHNLPPSIPPRANSTTDSPQRERGGTHASGSVSGSDSPYKGLVGSAGQQSPSQGSRSDLDSLLDGVRGATESFGGDSAEADLLGSAVSDVGVESRDKEGGGGVVLIPDLL